MSTMETEEKREQQEEQPNKEAAIEECFENAMIIEANLLATGNKAMELSDFPFHCPLPLELNSEVYKCLPVPIQTKFIWGLGRGIYAAFRHKLLVKTKKLRNPPENLWIRTQKTKRISPDGLTINHVWIYFFSKLAFKVTGDCRKKDDYPGTILYYFEVAKTSSSKSKFWVALSNGKISADGQSVGEIRNYYHFGNGYDYCLVSGNKHTFEWTNGAIKPNWNGKNDVVGCGLVLSPRNQLAIFYTGNGILMGKQIQINSSAECLYPMVIIDAHANVPLQTNFGDDPTKPFKYDIEKCPGLDFNLL